VRTISVGVSDTGRKRAINEDSYLTDDEQGLYVVADGVGGHNKGEIASREAIEHIGNWVAAARNQIEAGFARNARGEDLGIYDVRRALESGVQQACYMVNSMADQDPTKRGMSTTVSALLIRESFAFVAHVGDSRVYRVRDGEVLPITEDHTLVNYKLKQGLITEEEALHAKGKNVITRAVGHKDYVEVDTLPIPLFPGDRLVLCSDGLHGYIETPEHMRYFLDMEVEDAVLEAIKFANDRGGKDNITALMVELVDDDE